MIRDIELLLEKYYKLCMNSSSSEERAFLLEIIRDLEELLRKAVS